MASHYALRCLLFAPVLLLSIAKAEDLAPVTEFEGKPLAGIRFEPLQQPVTRADLARLMPFQTGEPIHLADVQVAIKSLFSTGDYSDIQVETEAAPNGVVLVFRTADQWFVGPVEVRGDLTLPPNAGQLANAARLELGTPLNDGDLDAAQNGVLDLLKRNGLYLSKIERKVSRDDEHRLVSLTFQVDAGKRARFTGPVVQGDTRLPAAELEKAAKYKGWFRWKPATEENTQAGLRNIERRYDKDERLTADVSLDHMEYIKAENRVRPTIEANGGPKIKIQATGAKVSKSDLKKYVPVYDEQTVNRDLLVTGVRNLRDYLQNKGYFEATVDFESKQINPDREEITYTIAPGERHKLVSVEITGNRYFTTDEIKERMFLQPAGFLRLRHGRYSEGFAKRDQDSIKALYDSNGFRDVNVTIQTIDDFQGKKGDVGAVVKIVEGPQYRVSDLAVDGLDRKDRESILARLSQTQGQPFSESSVATDRDYFLNLYQSEGYPDVSFEYRVAPGPGPNEMKVFYTIKPGAPRYVRDVLVMGLRNTRHRLVDPNILLKSGDPLSWTTMGRMQRRLYNLGVFDKVDMAIENPQGNTQNKYVLYHLTEGHRYYMAVGLGAEIARIGGSQSSLNAPSGATGFAPRGNLEVSRLNLWGLGHSLNFKSRYSTLDRRVSLNYLAPRYRNVDGRNISFTALYDNTRDVLTFTARRLEGSAQISQRISKPTTLLWRYTWRNVQVDQSTLKINPLLIPLASQASRIALIGANLIQDRRDDPANAHRGIYNTVDLSFVDHLLGGNRNFLRFLGRNSYYKQFHSLVLASNTEFGLIRAFSVTPGVDAFDYIPIPERFFGGGSSSHRGFPDNQAGPRDLLTGFPLGGKALLFHSTELRFPLIGDNIDGVLFHDLGNVYKDLGSISLRFHQRDLQDFDYMVHAAGLGIRYKTPVGPIRVDLAYSINPPTFYGLKGSYEDLIRGTATPQVQSVSHFQFFISIGQAF